MTRLEKKHSDLIDDFNAIMEWFQDYRGALLEAMDENIDLRIIDRQFKRKVRGNRYYRVTRQSAYHKIALGI